MGWDRICCRWGAARALLIGAACGLVCLGADAQPADDLAATARTKIAALGLRDNTYSSEEHPQRWLAVRKQHVLPLLIQGLDNSEKRVATECLKLLSDVRDNASLMAALVRIASDHTHTINAEATLALCPLVEHTGVRPILTRALADTERFPNARRRADIAEALGREETAVELLVQALTQAAEANDDWARYKIIDRLGRIGHKAAVPELETHARSEQWDIASRARLALAAVDPDGHGLTPDQCIFLREAGRTGKWTTEAQCAHWQRLTELKRDEIRPLVLQMLVSDRPHAAFFVLQKWQDRTALPVLHRLLMAANGWRREELIATCLTVDSSTDALELMFAFVSGHWRVKDGLPVPAPDGVRLATADTLDLEHLARAVVRSTMPVERKCTVLRAVHDEVAATRPWVVPRSLNWLTNKDRELPVLLRTLMDGEARLLALGAYAECAAGDEKKRFAAEVETALDTLISMKEWPRKGAEHAANAILEAVAAYRLPDVGARVHVLLTNDHAVVRIAAARVAALCGGDRPKALEVLHNGLSENEPHIRDEAAKALLAVPCLTDPERRERERAVLMHLGEPCEDSALRVLTSCAGADTTRQLSPLLDQHDVRRAVYAAWVLAQIAEEDVRENALRRVAIYAMFKRQVYQAGSGIDFQLARGLMFHQALSALNPDRSPARNAPLTLPRPLLGLFTWTVKEQAFAIRVYRATAPHPTELHAGTSPFLRGHQSWDVSHLPLLRVVAKEDVQLACLHVADHPVAHFPIRRAAAQAIVTVTGRPASYLGLDGEPMDSAAVPRVPYPNQNRLIAAFAVGRIASGPGWAIEPDGTPSWNRRNACETMLREWVRDEQFGKGLRAALLAEAEGRGLSERLRAAGWSLWL